MRTNKRKNLARRVFERDSWTCQMPKCRHPDGRPIDPGLAGTSGPWAPSVDHIVRKSENGPTVFGNLRAAHRLCNSADVAELVMNIGARIGEQAAARLAQMVANRFR